MTKFKKGIILVLVGLIMIPFCLVGYYFMSWKSNDINKNLSKKAIYKTFDHQKQSLIFGGDSNETKSNSLKITTGTKTDGEFYTCTIYDLKNMMEVTFRVGDGFSGGGYKVHLLGNRHKVEHYSYTDNPSSELFKDYSKLLESQLILDKDSYKKGDSLFGFIHFKFQNRYGPGKYFHEGKGYFKGIVK